MEDKKPNIFEIVILTVLPLLIFFFVFFSFGFITESGKAFMLAFALCLLSLILLRSRYEKIFGTSKRTFVEAKQEKPGSDSNVAWIAVKIILYVLTFFIFPPLFIVLVLAFENKGKFTSIEIGVIVLFCILLFAMIYSLSINMLAAGGFALILLVAIALLYFKMKIPLTKLIGMIGVAVFLLIFLYLCWVFVVFSFYFMPR